MRVAGLESYWLNPTKCWIQMQMEMQMQMDQGLHARSLAVACRLRLQLCSARQRCRPMALSLRQRLMREPLLLARRTHITRSDEQAVHPAAVHAWPCPALVAAPMDESDTPCAAPPVRPLAGKPGMPCTTCLHPTCANAPARLGVMPCPACPAGASIGASGSASSAGTLVLDPLSGPKWRLDCNRCNFLIYLPKELHSAKVSRSETCEVRQQQQ